MNFYDVRIFYHQHKSCPSHLWDRVVLHPSYNTEFMKIHDEFVCFRDQLSVRVIFYRVSQPPAPEVLEVNYVREGGNIQPDKMDSIYYYVPLFTILGCLISQGSSIKCYICSFSPYDRNNRTDKCTEENFQHEKVYSGECKLGCESVAQYDANDEMEQWKRNCLQEGHKLTNDCQTEKTPVLKLVRCTCDRDLCNLSTMIHSCYLYYFSAFITLLWRSYSKS
ncbi:uncharacterized protein TNCV_5049271 [Trichonephila clavipes]|nr:uncharacterized protein TNCV_5049271 [Trichonephila clavipes]